MALDASLADGLSEIDGGGDDHLFLIHAHHPDKVGAPADAQGGQLLLGQLGLFRGFQLVGEAALLLLAPRPLDDFGPRPRAFKEIRHSGSRLNLARVHEPVEYPVGTQAAFGEQEVRRGRGLLPRRGRPLSMTGEALRLREQFLSGFQALRAHVRGVEMDVGAKLRVQRGEVVHERGGVLLGHLEAGHPHLQPGPQGHDVAQEAEEPVRLHLPALAVQRGRAFRLVLVAPEEVAAPVLDHVAAAAVVFFDHPAAFFDAPRAIVQPGVDAVRRAVRRHGAEQGAYGGDFRVAELEIRHQEGFALRLVDLRVLELAEGPRLPCVRRIDHVPERKLERLLGGEAGEIRPDFGERLRAGNDVAAEAAARRHELPAPLEGGRVAQLPGFRPLGRRREADEVGRHRARLLIREAQAGHLRVGPIRLGVFQPPAQPVGPHLRADVLKGRGEVPVAIDDGPSVHALEGRAGVQVAFAPDVAAQAPDGLEDGFSLFNPRGVVQVRSLARLRLPLALPPDVGGDVERLLIRQAEIGHSGARVVVFRLLNPGDEPGGRHLFLDSRQVRPRLAQTLCARQGVTAVAPHLPREGDAARDLRRPGNVELLRVAASALGLGLAAVQHGVFPELHVAVGLLHAGDGGSLSAVAEGAADLVEFVLREIKAPVGVRAERLGRVFKPRAVDSQVAGLAPLHLHHRLVEVVALVFPQDDLVDLVGPAGDALEAPLLEGNRARGFSPRRLERFQFLPPGFNLRLYRVPGGFRLLRDRLYLVELGLGFIDLPLFGLLVVSLANGFLEVEIGLVEKGFSEAQLLDFLEGVELASGERLPERLQLLVAGELLLLGGDFPVEFGDSGAA